MTTKAWQQVMQVLVVLGIPAAALAQWHHLVARHPAIALALAIGWWLVCGLVLLARQALSGPVQRRLEQAGDAADKAVGWWLSGYGHRYRQWVLDSRRYIDVKDLATGGDHTPELDDVYVDVALVRRAPHQVHGNPLSGVAEDSAGRHSISEFLDRQSRVVLAVVGPPGSGKTTLLAHAARRSAGPWNRGRRRLPVLMALREHAASIAADPGISLPDVLRTTVGGVTGKEPNGWWERQLRRGRCSLLLDGLDEVAREEDRRVVATWVERQINTHTGNHFVITSRPHGFPGLVIAQADVLAVRPFTAEQVQLFLNRWYLAAERHVTGAVSKAQMRAVRIRARESAARLLTLLRAHSALHDLTVNPLLLTMIATVHRYRGALPGSRADLYGEICQVLLSRRIQAKDLPELLPWPAKQKLLAALAYEMMHGHVSELPTGRAVEFLEPQLHRLPQPVTVQEFLDDISRNGLLVEPAPGRYSFTHLTFQEYLAAQHISTNSGLVKILASDVDDPWWRETTLLYAAAADAGHIVRACLDSGTISALALAFDCAEVSSDLAPELRRRLDQVRQQAYEAGSDSRHRRLVAAVQAARLARNTLITTTGTRVCDRPVPADLYWLFLQDTQSPPPDSPCEPRTEQPAVGIWGGEARAFTQWLNSTTADAMNTGFRIPHLDELEEAAIATALTRQLPDSVTCAWTQAQKDIAAPDLWIRPEQRHPHLLTSEAICQAIVVDIKNTQIVIHVLAAMVLDNYLSVARARALALALAGALDRSLAPAVDRSLDRDRARALALDLALDRSLDRSLDLVRRLAREFDLDLDLDFDVILVRDLAGDRERALDLARSLNRTLDLDLDLARTLAPARSLDPAGFLDPARSLARARSLAHDLDRACDRARARVRALALDLDLDFDLDFDLYPRFRFLGIPGVPLRWVARGPLASTLLNIIAANSSPREIHQAFAIELVSRAVTGATAEIKASMDGSLAEALRDVAASVRPDPHSDKEWSLAAAVSCLADACGTVLSMHQYPSPSEAAAIRALALALASDSLVAGDNQALGVFQAVAATVTLIQNRAQGSAKIGESIILALG